MSNWQWSYSRWVGVKYGPVPVGAIVVVLGYVAYAVAK
jgi:hypothetical protein